MKNNRMISRVLLAELLMLLLLNCKKDTDNPIVPVLFNPNLTYGTMTDKDGNIYKTIKIGSQTWMAENLRTTKYRNGDPIPNITDYYIWRDLTSGAYGVSDVRNAVVYGHLYNWYAVSDKRNIAPAGWHVSTDNEWTTLIHYLGDDSIAGAKLKENGNGHWLTPVVAGTNEYGFTALPAGSRWNDGSFSVIGYVGLWWSVSEDNSANAWVREMSGTSYVTKFYGLDGTGKNFGYSVRCVKD